MHYQEINEILAKAKKRENMSVDYLRAISDANDYLLMKTQKRPEWIEGFLESNRCKLVETICRATSVQYGISSIQGYSEGYFNEIVQNANDLHYGDKIEIRVRKNGNICKLKCTYRDRGFELSNIYAFLNREMSDKVDDDSQTGKFGVGIKSFFKFVDRLRIESNVLFDFRIDKRDGDDFVAGITEVNTNWEKEFTSLTIEYDSLRQSEFNTKKLTNLMEYLDGIFEVDPLSFFIWGEDNEVVFDIRSLIFMKIKSKSKTNISKLVFQGEKHKIVIWCEEVEKKVDIKHEECLWNSGIIQLFMSVDESVLYNGKYIHFTSGGISAAFPVGRQHTTKNRMYSTYYLKEDIQERLLSSGSLFDTSDSNIHRNDVGDSEEAINRVYEKVRGYMINLFEMMCSEAVAALNFADCVSDVFHRFIALYYQKDRNKYLESPINLEYCNNSLLPKTTKGECKAYIVEHRDKEEYESATYQEGNIIREIKEAYYEFVEKNEVYDLYELLNNDSCIEGVKDVLIKVKEVGEFVPEENHKIVLSILNYYPSVREFLSYRVSNRRDGVSIMVSDFEVDTWLIGIRSEIGKYFDASVFLKLIGRYRLNQAVSYDGTVDANKLSFKDYLFNGILTEEEGILSSYQNKQFDEKYSALKVGLLSQRYTDSGNKQNKFLIRCIRPTGSSVSGWNGTYDYYEMIPPSEDNIKIPDLDLLIEKMAIDSTFSGVRTDGSYLRLFEKYARGMWRREHGFKHSKIIYQQIIRLSCLRNVKLNSFTKFVKAIKHRVLLREDLQKSISITCVEKSISTLDIINNVLPVIVEMPNAENKKYILDEYQPDDVQIYRIIEKSNNEIQKEYAYFVNKMTGFKIHVYRFVSGTRRKMIAYFGNDTCAVKTDSARSFRVVGKYLADDRNVYIFYDNYVGNLQDLVIGVLEEFNLSAKKLELMEGYISNGNITKTMNYMSRRRNLTRLKRKLVIDWVRNIDFDNISDVSDNEILYRLMTARGSYDIFCPICADIPLETFDYGEDTKKRHSRRIILMENSNSETMAEVPYIITIACNYCCERLRSTLSRADFDGKNIIITTSIAHGMHEKTISKQQIELSPVNIEIMKRFKL